LRASHSGGKKATPADIQGQILGFVCPHAGYVYSGKVAGAVYSQIEMPDTFIILGPNHTGLGTDFSLNSEGVWRMPFGEVNVDRNLAEGILKHSKYVEVDDMAHMHEHSIEVQLPFMQYFSKEFEIQLIDKTDAYVAKTESKTAPELNENSIP